MTHPTIIASQAVPQRLSSQRVYESPRGGARRFTSVAAVASLMVSATTPLQSVAQAQRRFDPESRSNLAVLNEEVQDIVAECDVHERDHVNAVTAMTYTNVIHQHNVENRTMACSLRVAVAQRQLLSDTSISQQGVATRSSFRRVSDRSTESVQKAFFEGHVEYRNPSCEANTIPRLGDGGVLSVVYSAIGVPAGIGILFVGGVFALLRPRT